MRREIEPLLEGTLRATYLSSPYAQRLQKAVTAAKRRGPRSPPGLEPSQCDRLRERLPEAAWVVDTMGVAVACAMDMVWRSTA